MLMMLMNESNPGSVPVARRDSPCCHLDGRARGEDVALSLSLVVAGAERRALLPAVALSLSLSLARLAAPIGKQYSVVVKAQNKATGETTSSDVATVTCDASEKAKALADQMRAQLEQQASEQEARKGAASSKLEARLAKRKAATAKAAA